MHIPRIWERQSVEGVNARGDQVHATAWGWSESSPEEARQRAKKSATRVLNWLSTDFQGQAPLHYGYDQRLPREEIIKEYVDQQGEPLAFVSRNQYGSLILNTRDLMFIDVDIPQPPSQGPFAFFKNLFGGKKSPPPADPAADLFARIRETAMQHGETGFRVYRTHSGFRLMVTNEQFPADSSRAQLFLREFQADPLYVRMCKNQQCFRARLTPKPWRCYVRMPPTKYPFADAEAEAVYRSWEKTYNDGVQDYRTAQLVQSIGDESILPEFEELLELHDRLCKVHASEPLA